MRAARWWLRATDVSSIDAIQAFLSDLSPIEISYAGFYGKGPDQLIGYPRTVTHRLICRSPG